MNDAARRRHEAVAAARIDQEGAGRVGRGRGSAMSGPSPGAREASGSPRDRAAWRSAAAGPAMRARQNINRERPHGAQPAPRRRHGDPRGAARPRASPQGRAAPRGSPWRRRGAGRAASRAALMRAFAIDVLACPHCRGRLRLIATLHDPAVTRKLLGHLEMARSGRAPAPPRPNPTPPRPDRFGTRRPPSCPRGAASSVRTRLGPRAG